MSINIVMPFIEAINAEIFSEPKNVNYKDVGKNSSFEEKMKELNSFNLIPMEAKSTVDKVSEIGKVHNNDGLKSTIEIIIKKLNDYQNRLSEIIKETSNNRRKFTAQQLLAFQAEMHRITYQIELVSKLIEQFTNGLKTTLQTQI